jgi:hypothetical protein
MRLRRTAPTDYTSFLLGSLPVEALLNRVCNMDETISLTKHSWRGQLGRCRVLTLASCLLMAGCSTGNTGYVRVISSHTLRVKADQDVDTVWLIVDDVLMRCSGGTNPPACTTVRRLSDAH